MATWSTEDLDALQAVVTANGLPPRNQEQAELWEQAVWAAEPRLFGRSARGCRDRYERLRRQERVQVVLPFVRAPLRSTANLPPRLPPAYQNFAPVPPPVLPKKSGTALFFLLSFLVVSITMIIIFGCSGAIVKRGVFGVEVYQSPIDVNVTSWGELVSMPFFGQTLPVLNCTFPRELDGSLGVPAAVTALESEGTISLSDLAPLYASLSSRHPASKPELSEPEPQHFSTTFSAQHHGKETQHPAFQSTQSPEHFLYTAPKATLQNGNRALFLNEHVFEGEQELLARGDCLMEKEYFGTSRKQKNLRLGQETEEGLVSFTRACDPFALLFLFACLSPVLALFLLLARAHGGAKHLIRRVFGQLPALLTSAGLVGLWVLFGGMAICFFGGTVCIHPFIPLALSLYPRSFRKGLVDSPRATFVSPEDTPISPVTPAWPRIARVLAGRQQTTSGATLDPPGLATPSGPTFHSPPPRLALFQSPGPHFSSLSPSPRVPLPPPIPGTSMSFTLGRTAMNRLPMALRGVAESSEPCL